MDSLKRAARRLLRRPLAAAAHAAVRAARRAGVPFSEFDRRGWLPVPIHYYHPYPAEDELAAGGFWTKESRLDGVALDLAGSLELLRKLGREYGEECRWPEEGPGPGRYFAQNGAFGFSSAAVAHVMVRRHRPRRVIEVGSGFSTHVLSGALARNTAEGSPGEITSIEPFPPATLAGDIPHLTRRVERRVETVDPALFSELGEHDLLFIDSSHVIRYGGDVLFLYLEVLPSLAPGVVVHVHDIHLPEPYPRTYFDDQRLVWNEQQLLHAFLCHNGAFEVLLPCWMIHSRHDEVFAEAFAAYDPARHRPGSSFWMRRVR
jgi:hypothetical protein